MAADGSVVFSVELDDKEAQKELHKLKDKIIALENEKNIREGQKNELSEELAVTAARADEAKVRLEELRNEKDRIANLTPYDGEEFLRAKEQIEKVKEEIKEVEKEVQAWDKEVARVDNAVIRHEEHLRDINAAIEAEKRAYAEVANAEIREYRRNLKDAEAAEESLTRGAKNAEAVIKRIPPEGKAISAAMEEAAKKINKIQNKLGSMLKRVFVFNVISIGLRELKEYLWENIQISREAQAAIAKLRGALLTLAQPLVNVIIPAFTQFVEILAKFASTAAKITSKLFGTTVEQSAEQAKAAKEARDNLGKEEKAIKDTSKAAKEATKQFADFDEIQQLTSDHADEDSDSTKLDQESVEEQNPPDFDSVISNQLNGIGELITGIALVALGCIILFSGANIPLGLGMIIVGALMIWDAVSENWDEIANQLKGPIGAITAILGAALLVIGAILTFTGANIPLGLGLMVIGAAALAAAIAANWDTISGLLKGPLGVVFALVSTALLVMGAIFTFSGANIPLGIALMVAGAIGLVTTIAANWDTIQAALRGPIGAITAIVSAALLVMGAILTFSGANIPLGIGMMVVGAIGLATTIAANWDRIPELLRGPVGVVVAIISAVLLVMGAIFAFSGANIPLGIGLMIAGAVGLGATIIANWDRIPELLRGPVGIVVGIISAALLVLGAIFAFSGANIPLGIGLMIAGAVGLASVVTVNWETISNAMQGPIGAITAIISASLIVIGVILLFSGVGIPIGLGLILAGIAGLVAAIAPNWDFLVDKLSQVWDEIYKGIRESWNAIKEFFANIFGTIKEAFVTAFESIAEFLARIWQIIKEGAQAAWNGIWLIIKGVINWILGGVETFINGIIAMINAVLRMISTIASAFSGLFGLGDVNISISPVRIPRLAAGAVIPPNREFLAVLGDQTSGNNIEAPEALLRQMAQEAASANTELLREILQAIKAGQTIEVDRQPFGRVVREAYNRESSRVGSSLIKMT